MKQITSTQNALVKEILQLQDKSRHRRKTGLFVIEGQREIELAIKGGYSLKQLITVPDLAGGFPEELLALVDSKPEYISVTPEVYSKIAYRSGTEGVLAIAHQEPGKLSELRFQNENPLVLVAESIEKPGNIGALLRTADAANVDAVIIADPKTDLYNPNIIRSSVGCLFTNRVYTGSSAEVIDFLRKNNIKIFCASLNASTSYHYIDYKQPTAIVVGTEATGLTDTWLEASNQNIIIPMLGEIDSMNVSVSAAIIIFEAKRQRNFQ
ncbi:TrmH family RNA methyltransferase [Robertkochia aurantiaca]|uniref:TrmH family RNA methyltransferase n=1 Tax=Robertkochia aurantiaca TaxID=2873700 RepID=UPI001CCCA06E|nr:RNA methyltransferase [Robertkochia sp. 3YJGBD-33]